MSLNFRFAHESDLQEVSRLVNSAYRGDSSRQGWTTEADFLAGQRTDFDSLKTLIQTPGNYLLLGFENGKLVSSVALEKQNGQAYFGMFTVDPTLQKSGIGKSVLLEIDRIVKDDWGFSTIEITVITLRSELIAWYEKNGFRATGEVRPFPYGDEKFGIPLRDDLQFGIWKKSL